jgi:phosphate uptake regulator
MKTAIAISTLLLALPLTACGEDTPAVCTSADDLKASVNDVKKIDVDSSSALTDLKSALKQVRSDLADVKADAKSEFSSGLDAVDKSYAALKTSIEAAATTPGTDTLAAAGAALKAFGTSVQNLITDIQETC